MIEPVRIVVDGVPHGKARPRFVRATGATYTPRATVNYETTVGWTASVAMVGRLLLEGSLALTVSAFMPVPTSWSRKKQDAALAGMIRPRGPLDADNALKIAMDSLNGIVWLDDAQVADASVSKHYAAKPRLEIEVKGARDG
jgi:Holliday junction resolvase RusA-like endonuclease